MYFNTETVTFHRLTRYSTIKGMTHERKIITNKEYQNRHKNFSDTFFTLNLQIENITECPIVLYANRNSNPTTIPPTPNIDEKSLGIYIRVFHSVTRENKSGKNYFSPQFVDIFIDHTLLHRSMYFLEEIDAYVGFEYNLPAIQKQLKNDVSQFKRAATLEIPSSTIGTTVDPAAVYVEYRHITERFLEDYSKITFYTGNIKRLENVRLSLWDNNFVPSIHNKVIYDPALPEDFVIGFDDGPENTMFPVISFDELEGSGRIYVDPDETETMFGTFSGMVVFANQDELVEYVHRKKSEMRYQDEHRYLSELNGNKTLMEKIEDRNRDIIELREIVSNKDIDLKNLSERNIKLNKENKFLSDQIEMLEKGGVAKHSADVVQGTVLNAKAKLENERIEIDDKPRQRKTEAKISMFKHIADMFKSTQVLIVAIIGVVTTGIALYVKYTKVPVPA